MHVGNYLDMVGESERQLCAALRIVGEHHGDEPDVHETCLLLATWSHTHDETLAPLRTRYARMQSAPPERLLQTPFELPRSGALALLRDLHDLWLLANQVQMCYLVLAQAAAALRDPELQEACRDLSADTHRQIAWLTTRIKVAAPQALVVAS